MPALAILVLVLFQSDAARRALPEANKITIIDGGPFRPFSKTYFDAGPSTGDIINNHFFPSLVGYNTGRYRYAAEDFSYVIDRPTYMDVNPRKAEFLSVAYYLRGMIYLHHAKGVGRHTLAKQDFEAAIKWNPTNHMAYLELSRVYSDLGFVSQANSIIDKLLKLNPPQDVAAEAETELKKLVEKQPN